MYPASSRGLNKETNKAVYFFTTSFYPLDNFSAHAVRIWGKVFPTAEHAFQWKKFTSSHPKIAKRIFLAGSPHLVKQISDHHRSKVSSQWYQERVATMEKILQAKVKQHGDVREALQRTGRRMIIENSPVDSFWGAGPNGKGKNIVGQIWMKIRKDHTS